MLGNALHMLSTQEEDGNLNYQQKGRMENTAGE